MEVEAGRLKGEGGPVQASLTENFRTHHDVRSCVIWHRASWSLEVQNNTVNVYSGIRTAVEGLSACLYCHSSRT